MLQQHQSISQSFQVQPQNKRRPVLCGYHRPPAISSRSKPLNLELALSGVSIAWYMKRVITLFVLYLFTNLLLLPFCVSSLVSAASLDTNRAAAFLPPLLLSVCFSSAQLLLFVGICSVGVCFNDDDDDNDHCCGTYSLSSAVAFSVIFTISDVIAGVWLSYTIANTKLPREDGLLVASSLTSAILSFGRSLLGLAVILSTSCGLNTLIRQRDSPEVVHRCRSCSADLYVPVNDNTTVKMTNKERLYQNDV